MVNENPEITYTFKVDSARHGKLQREVKLGFDSIVIEGLVEGMQLEFPDGLSLHSRPTTRQKLVRSIMITGKLAK